MTKEISLLRLARSATQGFLDARLRGQALRIKSGQTVRIVTISTISHGGVNTRVDPVTFFGRNGIPADQVLKDAMDIFNGAAVEASLTPTLQFIVHKGAGKTIFWSRAEDATHYYAMGMDLDLDVAMKNAVQETVAFLRAKKGQSAADTYSLASIGVDFRVAETVDAVQMVYGDDPKNIFKTNPEYWLKK